MAMHFKKQEKTEAERKKSTERRGFYLALAVCLTAIGIAAWSTYDTVSGFLEPTGSESSASSAASTPRPTPETSVPVDDDPESAVSAGHAQGTVPEVSASTEAEPQEVNAPVEETLVEETAAEPTYTVSETLTRPVPGEVMTEFSDTPVYSETMRDYRGARRNRARLRKRNRKRDAYGHAAREYDCDRARRLRSALLRTR